MTMAIAANPATNPERLFYRWMIVAIAASVVLGFSRSFFLRPLFPAAHAPHETWFYVHGALFTFWLALLLTQASLIGAGRVALHQKLGLVGLAMVPLMVFMGSVGALIAARRPGGFIDIPAPPLVFLIVPLSGMVLFAGLAGTALALRRHPQAHKRLMLLATIAIAEAGIGRWPFEPYISSPPVVYWTMTALVVPIAAWDLYSRRKLHPATLIGGVLIALAGPVRDVISATPQWLSFAKWSTGLLGPA